MQNLISRLQHFFTPASRPGDNCVEKNSGQAPTLKSLQTGKSSSGIYLMLERKPFSAKNNGAVRSGEHHADATPPTYRAGTEHPEETPQITHDIVLQHIKRNEINLLQSVLHDFGRLRQIY